MKKVVVILADGFEEIEAVTSIDILRRADLDVTLAGVGRRSINGAHDIEIETDMEISQYRGIPDALVLPGGVPGVNNLAGSGKVNKLIRKTFEKGNIIAAICAAPAYVLGPAGVLKDKKATGYPGSEGLLRKKARFVDRNVVCDGNIITSKGPGTAAHFALKLVEVLAGKAAARSVKKKTLYEIS